VLGLAHDHIERLAELLNTVDRLVLPWATPDESPRDSTLL
jgi:hypothetical protein